MKIIEKILKTGDNQIFKKLQTYLNDVNLLEDKFKVLSDEELKDESQFLKREYKAGKTLEDLLPAAFAIVREASRRTLGLRHFDVQIMGGINLHLGNISEMKTGEGKTLVATLPAYLNAITGKGVHIVTVNDYLSEYQSKSMGRIFEFLNLTCGCILSKMTPNQRRKEYNCDITYGTNNEFGFDYLRDNMALNKKDFVQRNHNFAIIDEVDSILIDEARTPLIISGISSYEMSEYYKEFSLIAKRLKIDYDYKLDKKKKTIFFLDSGIDKVEDYLGFSNLYDSKNAYLISFLNNAIKAKEFFKKDKDYVIQNSSIVIIDEHTGRILPGRRYGEGIHQAIEAKEKVKIQPENKTMATITLQNYFRLYKKLSGMTGTAKGEAAELMSTYGLNVVCIPTNKPMQRVDHLDLIFKNEIVKFNAVVEDIKRRNIKGQPILIGTTSVEKSEYLSSKLHKEGIKHKVLNAKFHALEAEIIAQAGRIGAVTVATNMAGRGTDIMLGGNYEYIALSEIKKLSSNYDKLSKDKYEKLCSNIFSNAKQNVELEHEKVVKLGGLYVIGTERHESRRIDNQLRGRSGRQGDPGESRFYLSMTDDLMRTFNPVMSQRVANSSIPENMSIESKFVAKAILSAQSQIEAIHADQRKSILKYDDVMNRQREIIYKDRHIILQGTNIKEKIIEFIEYTISQIINNNITNHKKIDIKSLENLWQELKDIYNLNIEIDDIVDIKNKTKKTALNIDNLKQKLYSDARFQYSAKEKIIGIDVLRNIERKIVLSLINEKWQEHLYKMDFLKESVSLFSVVHRDPLLEYQRKGYHLFNKMTQEIRINSVKLLFSVKIDN